MGIRDFPSLAEAEAWLGTEGFQRVAPPDASWVRDCFSNPATGQGATIGMNMAGVHRAYWWPSDHHASRQLRQAYESAAAEAKQREAARLAALEVAYCHGHVTQAEWQNGGA